MANIAPIPETPLPPPVNRSAGIGEASRNVLVRFAVEVFNRVATTLSGVLRHATSSVLEILEHELNLLLGPFYTFLLNNPRLPAEVRTIIERVRSGEFQVGAALAGSLATGALGSMSQSALGPISRMIGYAMDNTFHSARLDYGTLRMATLRKTDYGGDKAVELADLGWSPDQIAMADLASEQRLGATELITLWLRKEITPDELARRLVEQGIPSTQHPELKKLAYGIPGPGDLVRFALREAWRDDIAAAWGYDQGQPDAFKDYMDKSGYAPEWARAFWRSHWEIPSISMLFEMMQREVITPAQMVDGLKINDLAPGWIPFLTKISYNLLTRVDVKRALRYGLMTPAQTLIEYTHQGYTDADAAILRDIAIKETIDETSGLTQASIVAAYKKRRLSRSEATSMLASIGTLANVADFQLEQADLDVADGLLDKKVALVQKRFTQGLISENDASIELSQLGVGGEEARVYLDTWKLSLQTTSKRPSRANLDSFFEQGTISSDTYRSEMSLLGYDTTYIGWYLSSLAFKRAQDAAAETERAQKEQERVAALRASTAYERSKAQIDRDIAQLNAAIADAQVALVEAENERDTEVNQVLTARQVAALESEYRPLFNDVDAAIATGRLSTQKLSTAITEANASINDLRRSLAAGEDIVATQKLQTDRAGLTTQIALYNQQIAQRRTDIARLQESIPLLETAEEADAVATDILALKTQIAEQSELVADAQVEIKRIDALLPVRLTAEARATIEDQVRGLQATVDDYRNQVAALQQTISATQAERLAIEQKYDKQLAEMPGREDQIAIQAQWATTIDRIQSRIAELRSNVASKRLEKSELVVEWRD
jgi:hypothetical protein